jgi:hypothetical protein
MRNSVPSHPVAIVSCHVEQPLRDAAWARFDELQQRRPGGFDVIALMRPPDAAYGEDVELWLTRARAVARRGPFGLHTHWTSPTHARPTGGDPAARVRKEVEWMRLQNLEPEYFCGGGWYTDDAVRQTLRELGLVDCTDRVGQPSEDALPTTHSLGQLARGVLGPLPPYVHAYFHDYDLLDSVRRRALAGSMTVLRRRRAPLTLSTGSAR